MDLHEADTDSEVGSLLPSGHPGEEGLHDVGDHALLLPSGSEGAAHRVGLSRPSLPVSQHRGIVSLEKPVHEGQDAFAEELCGGGRRRPEYGVELEAVVGLSGHLRKEQKRDWR